MDDRHERNKTPLLLDRDEKRGRPLLFSDNSEKRRSFFTMTNLLRGFFSLCLAYTVLARAFPATPQQIIAEDVPKPLQPNVCALISLGL
jgi:hypothetical protein